jgi:hypothetical protein
LALSVPLSRFTSRVGGGSAFYVIGTHFMADFIYSFQEFCDHLAAMEIVRDYEFITLRNGESIELSGDRSFESMVIRVMDYMRQIYPNKQEAFFKGSRLTMILNRAASDIQELEDARLAVIGGEDKASLIHHRTWIALHHFYAVLPINRSEATTEEIIAYAKTLPEDTAA